MSPLAMSSYDYDLFVVGGGSGGVRAARLAAAAGLRVALAERGALGGTCVNVGCVPKKLYVYGSHYSEELQTARSFGWDLQKSLSDHPDHSDHLGHPGFSDFSWKRLQASKDREIGRLNGVYADLLASSGVGLLRGSARLTSEHTLEVAGREYSGSRILIATGSEPYMPDLPGREHISVSTDIFVQRELPRRIAVVGGGYIAVEFASIFHALGCETTLIYRGPLFLKRFDDSIRSFFAEELRKKGLQILFNTDVTSIEKRAAGGLLVSLKSARARQAEGSNQGSRQGSDPSGGRESRQGGAESGIPKFLEADQILYATGRVPLIRGLGLQNIGVELTEGQAIKVDAAFQSSIASIYALGDVIGRVQLTPVALAEAACFVSNLVSAGRQSGRMQRVDYSLIPTAIFSQPPIGTVGLAEQEARQNYSRVVIYQSRFRPLKYTLGGSDEMTLMKLVVDADSDRILGAHLVGPEAGEIIQGLAIAMKAGATKEIFDATIGVHPTSAEEFVSMRQPSG